MDIKALPQLFSVCRAERAEDADLAAEFVFFSRTDQELSLVCPTELVPERTLAREDNWRAFRVEGTLDFSLTGVLAKISGLLAEAGIPIFAISTYNTDYIMTKAEHFGRALSLLAQNGYTPIN